MSRAEKNIKAVKYHMQHPEIHNTFILERHMRKEKAREERVKQINTLLNNIHDRTYNSGTSMATEKVPYHPGKDITTMNFYSRVNNQDSQMTVSQLDKPTNSYATHITRFPDGVIQMHFSNPEVFPEIKQRPSTPIQYFRIGTPFQRWTDQVVLEAAPEHLPEKHQIFVIKMLSDALLEIEDTPAQKTEPLFELLRA